MNKFKFKVSKQPVKGSILSVNVSMRKWYIAYLWMKGMLAVLINR